MPKSTRTNPKPGDVIAYMESGERTGNSKRARSTDQMVERVIGADYLHRISRE